jgi:hypothetical protein
VTTAEQEAAQKIKKEVLRLVTGIIVSKAK